MLFKQFHKTPMTGNGLYHLFMVFVDNYNLIDYYRLLLIIVDYF